MWLGMGFLNHQQCETWCVKASKKQDPMESFLAACPSDDSPRDSLFIVFFRRLLRYTPWNSTISSVCHPDNRPFGSPKGSESSSNHQFSHHGSVENGCISNVGFLSFRLIFHFHDYGRKGSSGREQNPDVSKVFLSLQKNIALRNQGGVETGYQKSLPPKFPTQKMVFRSCQWWWWSFWVIKFSPNFFCEVASWWVVNE